MALQPNRRLDSWKSIADYLGRDLSTVRRWENEKGLPVHRVPGGKRQAVFAHSVEIDRWLSGLGNDEEISALVPGDGPQAGEGVKKSEPHPAQRGSGHSDPAIRDPLAYAGGSVFFHRFGPRVPPQVRPAAPTPQAASDTRFRLAILILAGAAIAAAAIFSLELRSTRSAPKVVNYVQITKDDRYKSGQILTDGSRLYFWEFFEGAILPVQVSAAGGPTVPISTSLQQVRLLDISPSRSEFLAFTFDSTQQEWPLWIMPFPAGSPHRLGNLFGHDGAWSPDGEKIVYANGQDLYVAKSDGMDTHKLVTLAGRAKWPRWSPDGRRLRFSIYDPKTGSRSLWEVSAGGTRLHPLLPGWTNPAAEDCGNWTPDGKYYVFQSSHSGKNDIWVLREEANLFRQAGREPLRLTSDRMENMFPMPSPDGKKLFVFGLLSRGELDRYDSNYHQFISYLSGISADGLAFSRDGEWVAYSTYPEHVLWRSRADGSGRLQLSFPPMETGLPCWSPDGRKLAFMGRFSGKPWKIYLVSSDGGGLEELMPGNFNQANPTWSPDGTSLAFAGAPWVEERTAPESTTIRVLDLKTRQVSTLTGSEGMWSPRWSPDGRYLVATPADWQTLMLFDFKTQAWSELAHLSIAYTSWSHDSSHIYFSTYPSVGDPAIYRVRMGDYRLERMASLRNVNQAWSLGPWFGLAPDDSFLILRETGISEIYALDWQLP